MKETAALVLASLAVLAIAWWLLAPSTPPSDPGMAAQSAVDERSGAPTQQDITAPGPTEVALAVPAIAPSLAPVPAPPRVDWVIEGIVFDERTQAPIEGAIVRRLPDSRYGEKAALDGWESATSDAQGRFELGLDLQARPLGFNRNVRLAVDKAGWSLPRAYEPSFSFGWLMPRCVQVAHDGSDQPTHVVMPMLPALELAGRVTHADGQPVVAGRVFLLEGFRDEQKGRWLHQRDPVASVALAQPKTDMAAELQPDGRFHLWAPPTQKGRLAFDIPGYGWGEYIYEAHRDKALELRVVLPAPTRLAGRIQDTDGGPVAGATVRHVTKGKTVENKLAQADAEGRFAIAALPPGKVELVAEAEGHEPASVARLTLAADAPTTDALLVVRRATHVVAGRVLDPDRRPHVAIPVSLSDPMDYIVRDGPRKMETDAQGSFRFEAVARSDKAQLRIGKWDERLEVEAPAIAYDDPAHIYTKPRLPRATLIVSVLDAATNEPVKSIHVEARDPDAPQPVIEDAELGIFRVEGVVAGGGADVLVSAPGYRPTFAGDELKVAAQFADGEVMRRTVMMQRPASLVGRVVDGRDQTPMSAVRVMLTDYTGTTLVRTDEVPRPSVVTDKDGRFRFDQAEAHDYHLVVEPPAPFERLQRKVVLAAGREIDAGDVALTYKPEGDYLRVSVLAPDGAPMSGVGVLAHTEIGGRPQWEATTAASGLAVVGPMSERPRVIVARSLGLQIRMYDAPPNLDEFTIPTGTGTIEVRLQINGQPATHPIHAGVSMALPSGARLEPSWDSAAFFTKEPGRFERRSLPPGRWKVSVDSASGMESKEVDVANGATTEVLFEINGGRIVGRVVDEQGQGLAGAKLTQPKAVGHNSWSFAPWSKTAEDGSFVYPGGSGSGFAGQTERVVVLDPGTYDLMVYHEKNWLAIERGIVVPPTGDAAPVTIVASLGRLAKLRVRLADGATGAVVQHPFVFTRQVGTSPSDGRPEQLDNPDGTVTILDLLPVEYKVSTVARGYADTESTVTLRPGEETVLELKTYAAGELEWSLVSSDGSPIEHARCVATALDGEPRDVVLRGSYKDGTWSDDSLAPGSYQVTAVVPGKDPVTIEVRIDAGATTRRQTVIP